MLDLSLEPTVAADIRFFSDASASDSKGFRAVFRLNWIRGDWEADFIKQARPSIEYLELAALVIGILMWSRHEELRNAKILLHCDNKAVVQMINNGSSSCRNCMNLIRILVPDGLRFNRRLQAQYIPTKSNCLTDALSRNQMQHFRKLGPYMNSSPDHIDDRVWPLGKLWMW